MKLENCFGKRKANSLSLFLSFGLLAHFTLAGPLAHLPILPLLPFPFLGRPNSGEQPPLPRPPLLLSPLTPWAHMSVPSSPSVPTSHAEVATAAPWSAVLPSSPPPIFTVVSFTVLSSLSPTFSHCKWWLVWPFSSAPVSSRRQSWPPPRRPCPLAAFSA